MRQLRSSRQISPPPALAQSNSAAPANVAARNSANTGEVIVSWTPNAAAVSNRVGWANLTEVRAAQAAGNWLEAFNFVEIGGAKNSYTVKRLDPGTQHAFIVATIAANGAFTYSAWVFLTTTAAHDDGFCPITGFAIGDGYKEFNEAASWGYPGFGMTVNRAVIHPFGTPYTPLNVVDPDTRTYERTPGRKLLRVYVALQNNTSRDVSLIPGYDYTISTDAGVALAVAGGKVVPNDGYAHNADILWEIPDDATVAVLAARPFYWTHSDEFDFSSLNTPTLFRIPIPAS